MSGAPDLAVRSADTADAETIGRLLHHFNSEFDETTPGPGFLRARAVTVRIAVVIVALAGLWPVAPASALKAKRLATFDQPVYVTAPPGDVRRVFVVERRGRIRILRGSRKLRRPFLDIRGQVQLRQPEVQTRDQGGLLGMAFAPGYRRSGRFYVFYTRRDGRIHVDEFRRARGDPNRASRRSRRTILSVPRVSRVDLGGQLAFGPDGHLYVGFGFGAESEESQDLASLRGKLIRVDPSGPGREGRPYAIPPGNPFVGRDDARPEIFASGLRVPYRFSFDRRTGALALADVGEDQIEEVNFLRRGRGAGANFGYPIFEGRRRIGPGSPAGLTAPVLTYPHSRGDCAIVGGYVARPRAPSRFRGRYVYGDVCTGRVRSARLRPGRARDDRSERLQIRYLVSFGEGGRGQLYAVSLRGPVYRLRAG